MVKHAIISVAILVFAAIFYNYSVNYITGKLELEWLEHGIMTNWDLRFIIILCVIGGLAGFGANKLRKRLRKK